MNKKLIIVLVLALLLVAIAELIVILFLGASKLNVIPEDSSIVVIRIDDVIYDAKKFTDRIDVYSDRDDVKAFVFRIESPGGTVAASQELSDALRRLRDSGKRVVTSIGNVGASGGYYIASQSDVIVANPGSITGSIGVIMEHMEVNGLTDRLGIKFSSITSGPMKDAGSIFRTMKPEERKVFESIIMDAYSQFRTAVLEGRWNALADAAGVEPGDTKAIEAQLDAVADGRILTGAQAYECGLADELGDLQAAIDAAEESAGITEEANIIYDNPEDPLAEFKKIFGLANRIITNPASAVSPHGGLWYLYR